MRIVLALCFMLFLSNQAQAACSSPAGAESQTRYDFAGHKMYYCNNTDWIESGGSGGGGAGAMDILWSGSKKGDGTVNLSNDADDYDALLIYHDDNTDVNTANSNTSDTERTVLMGKSIITNRLSLKASGDGDSFYVTSSGNQLFYNSTGADNSLKAVWGINFSGVSVPISYSASYCPGGTVAGM